MAVFVVGTLFHLLAAAPVDQTHPMAVVVVVLGVAAAVAVAVVLQVFLLL